MIAAVEAITLTTTIAGSLGIAYAVQKALLAALLRVMHADRR